MNAFNELNAQALAESISFIGENIQYKLQDIPAIVGDIRITEDLMDGGILEKRAIKVVIQQLNFVIPNVGEKIIYSGKGYRVLEVSEDSISWELVCDTDAK